MTQGGVAPKTEQLHVVIVGGGFAGLNAAKELRDAPVRITLVDRRNHHLFQPLLYQVATASLLPADIASPLRAVLRRQANVTVLMAEVTVIDLERQEVTLEGDPLRYDILILATGAETSYFGHDEWARWAPGLKSIDDAVEIRRRVFAAFEAAEKTNDLAERRRLLTFVVVGGGPTGVELAGALGEIAHHTLAAEFRRIDPEQTRILLVDGGDRILSTFPAKLSRSAARDLGRFGIEIRERARVTRVEPDAVWIGEEQIRTGTVIWAAGVRASSLAATLGVPLDRGGRVIVNPDLTIPGYTNAFALGDLALVKDRNGNPLPGTAPAAIQQAQWTAHNILRGLRGEPALPFHYRDRGVMATIGRHRAIAIVRGVGFDGLLAWLAWAVVHVYALIGFRNRVSVMLQWFWAYFTRQRTARLVTESPHRLPDQADRVRDESPVVRGLVTLTDPPSADRRDFDVVVASSPSSDGSTDLTSPLH